MYVTTTSVRFLLTPTINAMESSDLYFHGTDLCGCNSKTTCVNQCPSQCPTKNACPTLCVPKTCANQCPSQSPCVNKQPTTNPAN